MGKTNQHETTQLGLLENPESADIQPVDFGQQEAEQRLIQEKTPPPPRELTPNEKMRLGKLQAYKGLLEVFGLMNQSENFQNRFEINDKTNEGLRKTKFHRQYSGGQNTVYERSKNSMADKADDGRDYVREILGTAALIQARIITEKKAEESVNSTYGVLAGELQGLDEEKMAKRKRELGWVNRKIATLENPKPHA